MSGPLRTVLFVLGVMLASLGAAMLAPALMDFGAGADSAGVFFAAALGAGFFGGLLALMGRGPDLRVTPRGAILLTGGSWALLALAAAVPLRFSGAGLDWTDAIFEATSGITTTGATVITDLEAQSPGVLLWRALLQWIGGIGIIVTAMAVWPFLGVGGMQLFRLESSDASEKMLPRARQIAAAVGLIYLALTLFCYMGYRATGLSSFDALCHAMTTLATGGFSTRDESIGAFSEGGADLVALVFMILAGLPFLLYLRLLQGRPRALLFDPQVRVFLIIAAVATGILILWLRFSGVEAEAAPWRAASVNAVSILTGTGYASADYGAWGGGAAAVFFTLMFIGGCAGSTTCSVKVFRYQIAASALRAQLARFSRPHAVRAVRYRGQALPQQTVSSVLGYLFIFFLLYLVIAAALALVGLDSITTLSGAAATLANVGPGLGPIIGPAGTFEPLPGGAKWIMIFAMLTGRLEIFTVLVLLSPRFWRG